MYKLEFKAMGTQVLVAVDNDGTQVGAEIARVPDWFEAWEQIFSRFRPDSELSHLNASAGVAFSVSSELWEVVRLALRNAVESEGLVTPAVLPALELAGYSQSFELMAASLPIGVPDLSPALTDLDQIEMDPTLQAIRLPIGMRLDMGGVVKGWAVHQTMQNLRHLGAVLVDAGGDIAVSVPAGEIPGWGIDIQNPATSTIEETLWLRAGGVATSGRDRRQWQIDGHSRHHIIDPRSGEPAVTDVVTATVLAPTVLEAEMAAKMALILGSYAGMDWLASKRNLAALIFTEDGILRTAYFDEIKKDQPWN